MTRATIQKAFILELHMVKGSGEKENNMIDKLAAYHRGEVRSIYVVVTWTLSKEGFEVW